MCWYLRISASVRRTHWWSSGKSTFSATWNLHIPDMKYFLSCSHFHVGILQFHVAIMQFHVEFSVFTPSDMKLHIPTWNHMFRHETTFPDMNDFFRSDSGHSFFNFFLTFMSGRCNFTLFFANWLLLPDTILHFFSHNSYHFARFFATFLMEFAVSAMNLLLKWHFQVSFSNLGHACEHFMLAIMGFWYVKFLCFYSKSL